MLRRIIQKYKRPISLSVFIVVWFVLTLVVRHYFSYLATVNNADIFNQQELFFDFDLDARLIEVLSDETLRINPTNDCSCRKNTYIKLEKNFKASYDVYLVDINREKRLYLYEMDLKKIHSTHIPCNLYSMFYRGQHQSVVSYNLYGTSEFYYDKLKNVSRQIAEFYPGWLMRVYHDGSINKSIICDLECNEVGNVDFCDVTSLQVDLIDDRRFLNASHVHASIWRNLALADDFIDVVSFRDSDSFILQREVDSVNDWLKSDKTAHIMRDHPKHRDLIMAGMWGFRVRDDRTLAKKISSLVIDSNLSRYYNPDRLNYKRGDQDFLADQVYDLIRRRALIHDSYGCMSHQYSTHWPTRRQGNCYVGSSWFCDRNSSDFFVCPYQCRPPDHLDWIHC